MAAAAVHPRAGRSLHEAQRPAERRRERFRPGAAHDAAGDGPAVEIGDDLGAELDRAVGGRSVGEGQPQAFALRLVLRADAHEAAVSDEAVASAFGVDDVEAAVLEHAGGVELDLVEIDEREPLDGCDRDAGHRDHVAQAYVLAADVPRSTPVLVRCRAP